MTKIAIVGNELARLPWEDPPKESEEIIWRYSHNPIIGWNPTKTTARVFNSAVIPYHGKYVGVFRADHKTIRPNLHLGWSDDGFKWTLNEEIIPWKDEDGKPYIPSYAYDPRLVELESRYYVIWCTDFGGPAIGLGYTDDFQTFIRMDNAFIPFNRNGVLFPRKILNKYMMMTRPSDNGHTAFGDIYLSESPDLIHWGKHRKVMSRGGTGWWQGLKIGAGPIPIETTEGWLVIYHGVTNTCNGYVYSFGGAILDLDQPSIVLYRSRDYLLTPEKWYETTGFVPNVTFPCATLHDAKTGRIAIYYGAADTYLAVAFTYIDRLIEYIKRNSELVLGDGELLK